MCCVCRDRDLDEVVDVSDEEESVDDVDAGDAGQFLLCAVFEPCCTFLL